jgi:hypothetical protein
MRMTSVGVILIVGGLLYLGAEWKEDRDHPSRHRVPPEAELVTVTGNVLGARILESKSKKGVVLRHYIELDIDAAGKPVTVRLDQSLQSEVSALGGKVVTAKYDATDGMQVYSLSHETRDVVTYVRAAEEKAQRVAANAGGYKYGWAALGLGVFILVLGLKGGDSKEDDD